MKKNAVAILSGVVVLLVIAVVGISYAFYSIILRGEKENEVVIEGGGVTAVFTEPDEPLIVSESISSSEFMNLDSYDFTLDLSAKGTTDVEYRILVENISGSGPVEFYLTDEHNNPIIDKGGSFFTYDLFDGELNSINFIQKDTNGNWENMRASGTAIAIGGTHGGTFKDKQGVMNMLADLLHLEDGDTVYLAENLSGYYVTGANEIDFKRLKQEALCQLYTATVTPGEGGHNTYQLTPTGTYAYDDGDIECNAAVIDLSEYNQAGGDKVIISSIGGLNSGIWKDMGRDAYASKVNFENGLFIGNGLNNIYPAEQQTQHYVKNFRLRAWNQSQAITPTTDGNTHTGTTPEGGTYKFKVNVWVTD